MTIVYFDSSALVKLFVNEDGSALALQLWDNCDRAVSSRLAYPEVRAALAAAHRNRRLTSRRLAAAEESWEAIWSGTVPIELTETLERTAGRLAGQYALSGADSVHLAGALAIGPSDVVVAAWDRRLRDAASAAGLATAPRGDV